MSHTRLAALALAAASLTGLGCGGTKSSNPARSQSHSTSSAIAQPIGPPLSRYALVTKADAICKRVTESVAANTIGSIKEIPRVAPVLAREERRAFGELTELQPPISMAADWRQMVLDFKAMTDSIAVVGQYVASHNDLSGVQNLLATTSQAHRRLKDTAARNGFSDCARMT